MITEALVKAAVFGGTAPSIHNSQPWRWRIEADELDLRLDRTRLLATADPDARLAVLSCGAALHHARLELIAAGWTAEVDRLSPADGDHLARIRLTGRADPDRGAARLVRAALRRRTDRRPGAGPPLDYDKLRSIAAAVRAEGADLTTLRPRQTFGLAAALERAQEVEDADAAWQVELATWVGDPRSGGTGVPTSALPPDPLRRTAPARVLRRASAALIEDIRHHAAVFAVLSTAGDQRPDWLRGGEALSAGWLTATDIDVSVLPLSIVIEVAGSRSIVRDLLGPAGGHPHLVLRFTAGPPATAGPRTPRLPASTIIDRGGP